MAGAECRPGDQACTESCVTVEEEKCETSYGQECKTVTDTKCEVGYEKKCDTEYQEQCRYKPTGGDGIKEYNILISQNGI